MPCRPSHQHTLSSKAVHSTGPQFKSSACTEASIDHKSSTHIEMLLAGFFLLRLLGLRLFLHLDLNMRKC